MTTTQQSADERALNFLARLGAQPAVAFHENGVATAVRGALTEIGVSWRTDEFGNIIARIAGSDPVGVPPIAFMAHMDHPGFEVVGREGDYLVGRAAGGIPAGAFEDGVPLQIVLPAGRRVAAETAGKHGEERDREVLISLAGADSGDIPVPAPAVFDLPDFSAEDDYLVMRAADDLAGCGCILAALAQLHGNPPAGDVYGVFTRAEEVGLVGARLLAEAGTLPRETLVVSLESSRTLPGAEIGNGPVIRAGDAGSTFNHDAESALIRAREVLTAGDTGFRCQRQLMSGGVCEASAFLAYGYRATGVAFPLGNYHNGAPDGSVAAEYIHRSDYLNGAALVTESARQVGMRWDTAFSRRIRQVPDGMRARLGG
jgi:endoglucanase